MIYVITLPSIETRYTGQWYKWMWSYVDSTKRQDIRVMGDNLAIKIPPTEFLDFRQYYFKVYPFLMATIKVIKSGDTVFFMDGETAGVEAFEYIRKMENIKVDIRTFWHSGTYDKYDLTAIRGVHGENFERGWFDITDKIYVSSDFHKRLLVESRGVEKEKIIVTGNPLDLNLFSDGTKTIKTNNVMYAGRLVPEKGYDIVKELRKKRIDITVSLENKWDKKRFYEELAASKVLFSPSKQDMFATACMEAFGSNVPVLVPDIENYKEIIPERYRYKKLEDIDWNNLEKLSTGNERKLVEKFQYEKVMEEWFK